MKIHELLENIQKGSQYLGTYPLMELLPYAASKRINGLAGAKDSDREMYLAFINGEPEGAVYTDEKGVLFGDKAVLMITGSEKFVLTEIRADIIETLIMSSRIFDKNRLKKSITYAVPEIGKSRGGIGILTVKVVKDGNPSNGIRVSIRKDGKIVGSDTTTSEGTVGFRVAYDDYECILQDRAQVVTRHRITFDETRTSAILTI